MEIYTPERIAEFLLNNAVTKENYDSACAEVRALGLDPAKIPYTDPKMREGLPTNVEFKAQWEEIEKNLKLRRRTK
jgi:hypothetical protein